MQIIKRINNKKIKKIKKKFLKNYKILLIKKNILKKCFAYMHNQIQMYH